MTLINILQRYSDNGNSTLGLLHMGERGAVSKLQGYTLEDEARAVKVKGETRIPAGHYELKLRKELTPLTQKYRERFAWFSWHIEITGVPNFSNVYVHVGNKEQDTDACVLLGDGANNNMVTDGLISNSVEAYRRWYAQVFDCLLNNGEAFIEIRDEEVLRRAA